MQLEETPIFAEPYPVSLFYGTNMRMYAGKSNTRVNGGEVRESRMQQGEPPVNAVPCPV